MPFPETNKPTQETINNPFLLELEELFEAEVKKDELEGAYIVTFQFEEVESTIRFILNDSETKADITITNMTTLPDEEQGKGWGSIALRNIIRSAKANNLNNIQAVQVQDQSEAFWLKNGFVKMAEPNPTGVFVYKN